MLTALALAATIASAASVEGRPLRTVRRGDPDAPRRVLVIGSVHGNEPAGSAVVDLLRTRRAPGGAQIWTVRNLNPDGARRKQRGNARGVDLNRNFPHGWRPAGRGPFYPGPRAASEPETRWAVALIRAVRPHVTVWLHQPYGFVVDTPAAEAAVVRRYARVARLSIRRLPRYRGTATGWQNARSPGTSAFVVELPAGRRARSELMRHVRAIEAVARMQG